MTTQKTKTTTLFARKVKCINHTWAKKESKKRNVSLTQVIDELIEQARKSTGK